MNAPGTDAFGRFQAHGSSGTRERPHEHMTWGQRLEWLEKMARDLGWLSRTEMKFTVLALRARLERRRNKAAA